MVVLGVLPRLVDADTPSITRQEDEGTVSKTGIAFEASKAPRSCSAVTALPLRRTGRDGREGQLKPPPTHIPYLYIYICSSCPGKFKSEKTPLAPRKGPVGCKR